MSLIHPVDFDELRSAFPILPDTPLIRRAFAHARVHSAPYLFNHVARSWLFAVALGRKAGSPFDDEVVAAATLLHDMGLTEAVAGPHRFEVNGANAASAFVREQGFDDRRAQLVWDAIALHATPTIGIHKETEVALSVRGIGTDFGSPDYAAFAGSEMETIIAQVPRLNLKRAFKDCVCAIARDRPETTYDNFIRDFGERFVPGYKPASVVDFIMGGPFAE